MSIYILEDYLKACKVLEVEPTWKGLHNWKNQMWQE